MKRGHVKAWGLTLLVAVMGWILLSPDPLPLGFEIQRQTGFLAHTLLFALASLACLTAYPMKTYQVTATLLLAAIGLELVQGIIPGRDADLVDLLMNVVGTLIGATVAYALKKWNRNSS